MREGDYYHIALGVSITQETVFPKEKPSQGIMVQDILSATV